MNNIERAKTLEKIAELVESSESIEDAVDFVRSLNTQYSSSESNKDDCQDSDTFNGSRITTSLDSESELLQKYRNYFEEWLNLPLEEIIQAKGIILISNEKRRLKPRGWLMYLPICIFETNQAIIISCIPEWEDELRGKLNCVEAVDVMPIIKEYAKEKNLYCDGHLFYGLDALNNNIDFSGAILMDDTQYDQNWEFCSKLYPTMYEIIEPDEQMAEEFKSMIKKEPRYCYIVDGKIVSMTEAENVPNIPEGVIHLGINTLREYRRKGYAAEVCAAFIDNYIRRNIYPIWQCDITNTASQALAEKLGFKCLGSAYDVSAALASWEE